MPGWTRFYTDERCLGKKFTSDLHIDNVAIESENISQVNPHKKRRMANGYSGYGIDKLTGVH